MAAAKKPINPSTGLVLTVREKDQMSHLRARVNGMSMRLRKYFTAQMAVKEPVAVTRAKAVLAAHNAKVAEANVYQRAGENVTKVTNDLTTKVLFGDGLAALAAIEQWERKLEAAKC